ncbi:hypothetical protein D0Z03_002231 [Geotrichum reessii]|nr:hypothetical protein D0Z03_002231 [Galactomyces reessii]
MPELVDTDVLPSWLDDINDETLLSQLAIPGTHNSGASFIALPSVQCQGTDVSEQLEHGVRFLDFRMSRPLIKLFGSPDNLEVVHGKFPVKVPISLKVETVLNQVYSFLENHPSETVIVSIKQEGTGAWEGDDFPNLIWSKYIEPNQDKWYLEDKIPRLSDVRGKAFLFRRFGVNDETLKSHFGFDASWWKYNTPNDDRGKYTVQDWCEVQEPTDLEEKVRYINEQLKRASEFNATEEACQEDHAKLFVNFCSASNFFNPDIWPRKVADAVSRDIQGLESGCGVVITDYAENDDWKLTRQIVQLNMEKFRK